MAVVVNRTYVQNFVQNFVKLEAGQLDIMHEPVPASITHMGLFDRLYDNGIARTDGAIVKCMDEYIDGYQVSGQKVIAYASLCCTLLKQHYIYCQDQAHLCATL